MAGAQIIKRVPYAATLRRTEQRGNSFYYLLSCRNLTGPHHKRKGEFTQMLL